MSKREKKVYHDNWFTTVNTKHAFVGVHLKCWKKLNQLNGRFGLSLYRLAFHDTGWKSCRFTATLLKVFHLDADRNSGNGIEEGSETKLALDYNQSTDMSGTRREEKVLSLWLTEQTNKQKTIPFWPSLQSFILKIKARGRLKSWREFRSKKKKVYTNWQKTVKIEGISAQIPTNDFFPLLT